MKSVQLTLLLVAALFLTGCGKTAVGTSALVPESLLENTKSVSAEQGKIIVKSSLPNQMFFIDPNEFEDGLNNAFLASGLFSGGVNTYSIEADIQELDYPAFAATMDSTFSVVYNIKDETDHVIASKLISSNGECSMGEHFVGSVRAKRAIDRAITNQYPLVIEFLAAEIGNDLEKKLQ